MFLKTLLLFPHHFEEKKKGGGMNHKHRFSGNDDIKNPTIDQNIYFF